MHSESQGERTPGDHLRWDGHREDFLGRGRGAEPEGWAECEDSEAESETRRHRCHAGERFKAELRR